MHLLSLHCPDRRPTIALTSFYTLLRRSVVNWSNGPLTNSFWCVWVCCHQVVDFFPFISLCWIQPFAWNSAWNPVLGRSVEQLITSLLTSFCLSLLFFNQCLTVYIRKFWYIKKEAILCFKLTIYSEINQKLISATSVRSEPHYIILLRQICFFWSSSTCTLCIMIFPVGKVSISFFCHSLEQNLCLFHQSIGDLLSITRGYLVSSRNFYASLYGTFQNPAWDAMALNCKTRRSKLSITKNRHFQVDANSHYS